MRYCKFSELPHKVYFYTARFEGKNYDSLRFYKEGNAVWSPEFGDTELEADRECWYNPIEDYS